MQSEICLVKRGHYVHTSNRRRCKACGHQGESELSLTPIRTMTFPILLEIVVKTLNDVYLRQQWITICSLLENKQTMTEVETPDLIITI